MGHLLLSMMIQFDFLPLLLVIFVAWAIPMLLSFLKVRWIPAIILEIIAGFALSPIVLGISSELTLDVLQFLALGGFIFLMFLSGLEIDVDQITASFPRKKITLVSFLKNPLLVGIAFYLVTLGLSFLGTELVSVFIELKSKWFFTLILTTTSLGIIFPVLKNRGETIGHYGQMLVMAAALADIISILLLTFTAIVVRFGFSYELLLIAGLFVLFVVAYKIGRGLRILLFQKITFQLSHAASQISVRGTMLLILLFVVAAQFIGNEGVLLGAFLSGLLLSIFLHKDRSLLVIKLDGMGFGFFIPIFFIMVGVKFDTASLMEFDQSLIYILILLLAILFMVKVVPSVLWVRLFGWRRAIAGGFLLSARMSLIIAAASIGLELQVISPGINSSFIIMAVVTCFGAPIIYSKINRQAEFQGRKTIVVGGSSVGVLLVRRLKVHGKPAVIIEIDNRRYQELKGKGLPVVHGDALDTQMYRDLNLSSGDTVVVMTGSDEKNIRIAEILRKDLGHEKVISRTDSTRWDQILRNLGVEILDGRRVLATAIENLVLRPSTYQTLVETFETYSIEEISVTNPAMDGKQLREIPMHKDGTLVLIKREGQMFVPHGETFLRAGDLLTVFGTITALNELKKEVGG